MLADHVFFILSHWINKITIFWLNPKEVFLKNKNAYSDFWMEYCIAIIYIEKKLMHIVKWKGSYKTVYIICHFCKRKNLYIYIYIYTHTYIHTHTCTGICMHRLKTIQNISKCKSVFMGSTINGNINFLLLYNKLPQT